MQEIYKQKVLEFLSEAIKTTNDLLFIFTLPYGTSYSQMEYLLEKRKLQKDREKFNGQERRRFADFLYHLRKDNLIEEVSDKNKRFFKLTLKGRAILKKIQLRKLKFLPSPEYKNGKDSILKIIIFDIPEKEKRKREWLRSALVNLKFKMLQKSVWMGRVSLPKKFLADLDKINILSYIEIFAVTKIGSLRQAESE